MPLTPAWRGPDGALFLCPRPDLPRRAADEVGVELSAEARIEGTSLWPIVSWPGGRTAFRLHPDLVSDVRAAQPRSSWPRESFELRKPPLSPPPSGANSATTRGVELLLASQQRGHIEALAAAYFSNPAIHSRVREAVGRGRGGSALDVSALSVASRAADPSLWEVVAGRARGGDRPSMHALCGWRDARGHGFFEAALPPAVPGTTRLFVLDALSYFIGQGEGQGLDFLKGVLGDPIADAPGRPGSADARLLCGFTLNFLVDQGEFAPSSGWREFVACSLLLDSPTEESHVFLSDAVQALIRVADPRAPFVMWRLLLDGLFVESDIAPALALAEEEDITLICTTVLGRVQEALLTADDEAYGELADLRDLMLARL